MSDKIVCMYDLDHHNKYIDLELYGNNNNKYIDCDNLIAMITYKIYKSIGMTEQIYSQVKDLIYSLSNDIVIYLDDSTSKQIKSIELNKVESFLDEIVKLHTDENVLLYIDQLKKKISDISILSANDGDIFILSEYKNKMNKQDLNKYGIPMKKIDYIRPSNNLVYDDDIPYIKCYCCTNIFELYSDKIFIIQNIPLYKGGDWSKNNVYLCCKDCCTNMTNNNTKS